MAQHKTTNYHANRLKNNSYLFSFICVIVLFVFLSGTAIADTPEEEYNAGINAYNSESFEKAVEHFRIAAESGHSDAQNNLGLCYANGQGVQQDYKEAVKWYRLSAEQGNAYGQFNLGNCYANGQGVELNNMEAFEWIQKAADQGLPEAKEVIEYIIGLIVFFFFVGIGVTLILVIVLLATALIRRHSHSPSKLFCPTCGREIDVNTKMCSYCDKMLETPCEVFPFAARASAVSRWAARLVDYFLESVLIELIFLWALPFLDNAAAIILEAPFIFLLDSLFCWSFGGTLGKWLFGIKIVQANHSFATTKEFFKRNLRIYVGTFVLGIPVLNIIPWIIQYRRVSKDRPASYDEALQLESIVYNSNGLKTFFGIVLFILVSIIKGYLMSSQKIG